jgi:hypothetical protein
MTTTVAPPAPQTVVTGIIDGDGHSRERDEDLYPDFGAKYPLERLRNYRFPTLDGWRRAGGGTFGSAVEGWHQCMDWAGISRTVLFPTVSSLPQTTPTGRPPTSATRSVAFRRVRM